MHRSKKNQSKRNYLSGEDFSFRDWREEDIIAFFKNKIVQDFKEKHVGGIAELGHFHQHAIFEIFVITDDTEFLTTDNPLVLEDRISSTSDPLQKSQEFTISLNKKTALKVYHDNRKDLNKIYRRTAPNGTAEIINNSIIDQASRFIITSKEVLDRHNKFAVDFLDNTSLDLKINTTRQILEKFPVTPENKKSHELMQQYINKYDKEGHLTDQDVFEFVTQLRGLKKEFIKSLIN